MAYWKDWGTKVKEAIANGQLSQSAQLCWQCSKALPEAFLMVSACMKANNLPKATSNCINLLEYWSRQWAGTPPVVDCPSSRCEPLPCVICTQPASNYLWRVMASPSLLSSSPHTWASHWQTQVKNQMGKGILRNVCRGDRGGTAKMWAWLQIVHRFVFCNKSWHKNPWTCGHKHIWNTINLTTKKLIHTKFL